jgi:hypothetical protein
LSAWVCFLSRGDVVFFRPSSDFCSKQGGQMILRKSGPKCSPTHSLSKLPLYI